MTSEARVPVLMANDKNNQSLLFRPVDEEIRHCLEWIHPAATCQFGSEVRVTDDQRTNSLVFGEKSLGGG